MRIKIIQCPDEQKWYSELVGEYVPYLAYLPQEGLYKSREPAGYINFVEEKDGRLEVSD